MESRHGRRQQGVVTAFLAEPGGSLLLPERGNGVRPSWDAGLARWCDALQVWNLYALLLFLPFSKAAIEITSTLLIIGWVGARLLPSSRGATVWITPGYRALAWWLAALVGVYAASVLVSSFPESSLRGLVGKWMQYFFLLVVAADLVRRPAVLRRGLWVVLVSCALVIVESAWQEWRGAGLFLRHPVNSFGRMTGPYENPIDLATYFMVVVPILAGAALRQRGRARVAHWAVIGLAVICLGRTNSLGAWLGLGAGMAVFVTMRSSLVRRTGLIILLILIAAAGVFLAQHPARFFELGSLSEIGKVDRLAMWQAALGMIRDRPLLGHGLNTFMANYLAYWIGGDRQPRYAHNCYLQMTAETGLIGLVVFLGVLWQLFALVAAGFRRGDSARTLLLSGLAAGLLSFLAQAGIDTNFYSLRQATLFWTVAGVALGCAALPDEERSALSHRSAPA